MEAMMVAGSGRIEGESVSGRMVCRWGWSVYQQWIRIHHARNMSGQELRSWLSWLCMSLFKDVLRELSRTITVEQKGGTAVRKRWITWGIELR